MTTLYIAGPMTGLPAFNYPAFEKAAGDLIAAGYEVLSPHTIDATEDTEPGSQTWEWYMRRALSMMLRCDGVALLPGWRKSRGALIEVRLAEDVGMRLWSVKQWLLASEGRAS